jgi:cleavage and polyadenylation specificity factor subunit 3
MEKTTFKGRVFMTHPTRAIYKWLLSDYVKISSLSPEDQLYDETDLQKSYERIEVVDFHQEVDVAGVKFTPYNAGHVLGAAMFLIEIAGTF